MPRWFKSFIIEERRDDWKQPVAPCVIRGTTEGHVVDNLESGSPFDSTDEDEKTDSTAKTHRDANNDAQGGVFQRDSNSSLSAGKETVGKGP